MALIAENAGGKASDGACDILDLEPQQHHQRTPLCWKLQKCRRCSSGIARINYKDMDDGTKYPT